jgi:hypothetical protein
MIKPILFQVGAIALLLQEAHADGGMNAEYYLVKKSVDLLQVFCYSGYSFVSTLIFSRINHFLRVIIWQKVSRK